MLQPHRSGYIGCRRGGVRSYARDQRGALAAYDRTVELALQQPHFVYNRASVRRFLGDLGGAKADYDRVIALKPSDFEAFELDAGPIAVHRRCAPAEAQQIINCINGIPSAPSAHAVRNRGH